MNERQENSLQTAARWAGNLAIACIFLWVFSLLVGSVVWCIACLRVRNQPRKYRKVLKQFDVYTDPAMGIAYACGAIAVLLGLFALLILAHLIGGEAFENWWFHDVWGEPLPVPRT